MLSGLVGCVCVCVDVCCLVVQLAPQRAALAVKAAAAQSSCKSTGAQNFVEEVREALRHRIATATVEARGCR